MGRAQSIEGYRQIARRRLPPLIFDFIDGGAEDEATMVENERAFADLALRPAVLAGVGAEPPLGVEVAGQRLSLPVLLGPTGTSRIAGPEGEIGAARGAAAAGTTAIHSNGMSVPLDQVAAATETPQWQQVMFIQDRDWMTKLLERARRLGVHALVVTADAPVIGKRERDSRNGFDLPLRPRLRWLPGMARRPRWLAQTLRYPPVTAMALPELGEGISLEASVERMFNPGQSWDYLEWIRERWEGPLLLKGVMLAEDAERAVAIGCQGVIVSNHGGRQLDSVPSSIEMLPEVVAAVGDRAEVLLDGGVRRGTDVIKALALGARACLIGRPWLWGLRAGGAAGVTEVIEVLRDELRRSLILAGVRSVGELGPEVLMRRPNAGWARIAAPPTE